MADAAAARREARRKRILENSHNRLQLISGKSSDECTQEESSIKFPIPEQAIEVSVTPSSSSFCFDSPSGFANGVIVSEPESHGLLSASLDFVAAGDSELPSDLAAFGIPSPEQTQPKSPWDTLIASKYDIVLLSLLIQLLYSLSLFTFDNYYFFLPLIIYIVTKSVWVPAENTSNIANVFLLLNGMSASRANTIMNSVQWVGVISQDVCVYLFTTICLQSLIVVFNILVT